MKILRFAPVIVLLFFSLSVASVFANSEYPISIPILGTTGAPALGASGLFSGVMAVLYADGTPVVLSTNHVTLNLCTTSCTTVTVTLEQTAPGTYTYTFTPPTTLSGTITIYVQAENLADDNGRLFPSVDTSIGTYAYTPTTTTGTSAPVVPTTPNMAPTDKSLTYHIRQAVNMSQTPTAPTSLTESLLAVLSALAVAGCLLFLPPRH
jgi:hypothetical protein